MHETTRPLQHKRGLILLLLCLLCATACDEKEPSDYPYAAKVVGINPDCREWEILITEGLEKIRAMSGESPVDGLYIALGLPEEFKAGNLEIRLDCRPAEDTEVGLCTTMGPSLPWVVVTGSEKKP